MGHYRRSLALLAALRSVATRRLTLVLGWTAIPALALLLAATPAGAVVSEGFGQQRRLQPEIEPAPLQYHGGPVLHSSDSYAIYWDPIGNYRGDWKQLIDEYFHNVGAASGSLGDIFAVTGQYVDSKGYAANQSTFRGAYTDTNPYPTTENCTDAALFACLTDQQIRAELQRVISSGALPGATGPAVYYLLTPPGVTVCTDGGGAGNCSDSTAPAKNPPNGVCGYHSVINPGGPSPTVYVVQPWVAGKAGFIETEEPLVTTAPSREVLACQDNRSLQEPNQLPESSRNPFGDYAEGLADVIINDLSIEQSNVVVDPLLNGWYQTATGAEQSDMCQWGLGTRPEKPPPENKLTHAGTLSDEAINGHNYYIQWAFDSTGLTAGRGFYCWQGASLEPHFTAPNPVNAGDVVGFDGSESLITLDAHTRGLPADEPYLAPIYKWEFGDGTVISSTSPSQFHSYQYGGTYDVTLTVTDSGGNSAQFGDNINVVGPAPPSSPQSPGPSAQGAASTGTTGTSASNPVASDAVLSRSLTSALRNGLTVRYSVNEQVTGQFQVLLAASIAHRLGVHGARATGLAKGAAPEIVIAKAILVTTRGGHSTLKIQFSKSAATHLRQLRKVSLMLRLAVRNASSLGRASTTVLSVFTLTR